ncbi:MAG: sugar phosphate isomerase/epimerase family protein [Planctomycetota bacterium]
MSSGATRREFLQTSTIAGVAAGAGLWAGSQPASAAAKEESIEPAFRISLAEWSLHTALYGGKITNLDFPVITKQEFGLDAVEYVNAFFADKARDEAYLSDLKGRCDGEGVRSLLIMVDREGDLGAADEAERRQAVENHHKWVEAAKYLGCHSIRVNAASSGSFEEQQKLAADGLAKLGEFADQHGINVLVENHGGLSSNGAWLAGVMKLVSMPNVGTLPDFGNFRIGKKEDGEGYEWYDRYQGVQELMPYAKAVSAKSHKFDDAGNEVETDFFRMMKIVLEAGYSGYVGIEWEGGEPDEYEGIRLTKQLLERVREGIA